MGYVISSKKRTLRLWFGWDEVLNPSPTYRGGKFFRGSDKKTSEVDFLKWENVVESGGFTRSVLYTYEYIFLRGLWEKSIIYPIGYYFLIFDKINPLRV